MDTATIIKAIDAELEILVRVKNILGGHETYSPSPRGASKPQRRKYVLSSEARERIAAAQRKRWAKQKKEGA